MSKYGWAYISLDTLQSNGSPTGSLQFYVNKTTTSGSQKLLWLTASNTFVVGAPHTYDIGATNPSGPGCAMQVIGDVHVTGAIRATEYYVQTVSSSVTYAAGSHKFGDDSNDIHQVTGSLRLAAASALMVSGSTTLGDAASDVTTLTGQVTASAGVLLNSTLDVAGNTTLGNANTDVVTSTAQLTASSGLVVLGSDGLVVANAIPAQFLGNTTLGNAASDVITMTGQLTASAPVLLSGEEIKLGNAAADVVTLVGQMTASAGTQFVGPAEFQGNVSLGNAAADKITLTGQMTASAGTQFGGPADFQGNVTLGNAVSDVITVTGQVTSSHEALWSSNFIMNDDKKLYFGIGKDAHIEYDEDGADILRISGPTVGTAISGSVALNASQYLNFGALFGTNGYGIRDNSGVIEFKSSGGTWETIADTDNSGSALVHSTALMVTEGDLRVSGSATLGNAAADVITMVGQLTASNGVSFTGPDINFGNAASDVITLTGQMTASNGVQFTGPVDFQGNATLGNAASDVVTITSQVTASNGVQFSGPTDFQGNVTLGNAVSDIVTLTSQLTASTGIRLNDDVRLALGTDSDADLRHNGTNLVFDNSTGHFIVDNRAVDKDIRLILGTDTADTKFAVRDNSGNNLFAVGGNGNHTIGNTAADVITITGQVTASNGVLLNSTLDVAGNTTLGNAASDVITLTGQVTSSAGMLLNSHISASFVTASYFKGDGSQLTNVSAVGTSGSALLHSTTHMVTEGALGVSGSSVLMGSVGIGTDSPSHTLQVDSNSGVEGLQVNGAQNQYVASFRANTTTGKSYGPYVRGGTNSSDAALIVENATGTTSFLKITGEGKLGIGVSDPDQQLEVGGNIHLSSEVTAPSAPSAGDGGILYVKANGKLYWISDDVAETDLTAGGGGSASGSAEVHSTTFMVTQGALRCSGSATLGDAASDVVTLTGQVTASAGTFLNGHQIIKRVAKTSNYSAGATDYLIGVNSAGGTVDITIPSAGSTAAGRTLVIKDEGGSSASNRIRITGSNDGDLIDGSQYVDLESAYAALTLYCDGSNKWYIL